MSLAVLITASALYTGGVWLLVSRSLLRIILGVALIGHGSVVLLIVAAGTPGAPAFASEADTGQPVTDPLPQALGLTAIVITFALVAFLLALTWRHQAEFGTDRVLLDREDRRIATHDDHGDADRDQP
jgi:multicomponent Na+:H+ antiporter subunit C